MIVCSRLHAAEQRRVERLDGQILYWFWALGAQAHICQAAQFDGVRVLEFWNSHGVVARATADQFVSAASDVDALESLELLSTIE